MAFELITKYDSPNYGYPTGTTGQNNVKQIVIHHWGSDGMTFEGVVSWLCNPRAEVSAHYVVEKGRAACLVDWSNAAWHAGSRAVNKSSIGIECRPECTKADFDTVAQVVASIWKGLGKKVPLIGHKDVANTSCPGRYYPRLKELYELAEKYYKGEEKKEEPKKDTLVVDGIFGAKSVLALQEWLASYKDGVISSQLKAQAKYFPALIAVTYGDQGSVCIERLQKKIGLKGDDIDGFLGRNTIKALQNYLIKNKYDVGKHGADGYFGSDSAKAMQRFLNDNM